MSSSPHPVTTSENINSIMPHGIIAGLVTMLVAVLISFALYYLLPYEDNANKGLALLVFVAIMWFSEAVHISLTALMIPVAGVLLKLPEVTMKSALASFSDPIIYLFMGGFALAAALQIQQLDRKIARTIIQMSGSRLLFTTIALCAVTAFLSMWISNTATAAMMLPLALGVLTTIDKSDRGTRIFILLGIAYSASIGGIGTLIGSPPNAIAARALDMHFTDWLPYGLPLVFMLMPAMFIVLYIVCRPNFKQTIQLTDHDDIPWTPRRIMTLGVFLVTATAWIFGKKLGALGISSPDTFVAICAIIAVVVLGLAKWHDITENTDWGILLLFGGGIALSSLLQKSGASLVLGQQVASTFGQMPTIGLILIIATFIIFLTEFTSNTASAALLVPVFGTIAVEMGLPKEALILVIGVGASCAFMLPVATPPNAIVFGVGELRSRDMLKAGLWLNLVSIFVVGLFIYHMHSF